MGKPTLKVSAIGTIILIMIAASINLGAFYLFQQSSLLPEEESTSFGLRPKFLITGIMVVSGAVYLLLIIQAIRLHLRARRLTKNYRELQSDYIVTHDSNLALIQHVSHKIRTPLSTLTSSLEILKSSEVLEFQIDPINIMDSSLDAINVLVNDVMDTTAINEGGLKLSHELVTLNEFLESLYVGIRPLAEANGLILNFDWPNQENIGVDTDSLRLRQVVYNVLYNLISYNDRGIVSLQVTSSYLAEEAIQLQFLFNGTSIGMDEEQLDDYKEFLTNASETIDSRPEHLDIGLYNSTVIVREMGGVMNLSQSAAGGISLAITVAFPLYYSTRYGTTALYNTGSQQESTGQSAAFTKLTRALIVDDIPVNRLMMKKVIDKMGIISDEAGSGQEALQSLQQEPYELVLLDITMPDIDGIEVTRRIRSMQLEKQPVIIAVTATAVDSFRDDAEEAGMEAIITKPFKLDQLRAVLKEFFDLENVGKPRLKLR